MKRNKKSNALWWPWVIITAIAFTFPWIIYRIWGNDPKIDWIGFWASYAGAILGASASLVALYITYKQNEFENHKTREELEEKQRLQILPYITIRWNHLKVLEAPRKGFLIVVQQNKTLYISSEQISADANRYILESSMLKVNFKNVGLGTAIECEFLRYNEDHTGSLDSIMPQEEKSVYFLFPYTGESFKFKLQFKDLQNNKYYQNFLVVYERGTVSVLKSDVPHLEHDV